MWGRDWPPPDSWPRRSNWCLRSLRPRRGRSRSLDRWLDRRAASPCRPLRRHCCSQSRSAPERASPPRIGDCCQVYRSIHNHFFQYQCISAVRPTGGLQSITMFLSLCRDRRDRNTSESRVCSRGPTARRRTGRQSRSVPPPGLPLLGCVMGV